VTKLNVLLGFRVMKASLAQRSHHRSDSRDYMRLTTFPFLIKASHLPVPEKATKCLQNYRMPDIQQRLARSWVDAT